jgi:hypothetical protein
MHVFINQSKFIFIQPGSWGDFWTESIVLFNAMQLLYAISNCNTYALKYIFHIIHINLYIVYNFLFIFFYFVNLFVKF